MAVIRVKAWNYMMHKNIDINPNGESFLLVGESGSGKSIFLDMIAESIGIIPFHKNPLREGEESGGIEVTHNFGGDKTYVIRRRFNKKGLGRFEVIDKDGVTQKEGMETLIQRIFGKAFTNSYFDYKKYFYECKSSSARYEYILTSIGGEPVLANNNEIKKKTSERHEIGGKRTTYEALLEESIVDPETLEEDITKYASEKKLTEIYEDAAYLELKAQLKDKVALEEDYALVQKLNKEEEEKRERNLAIDSEIAELEKRIAALREEKAENETWIENNPADIPYEQELAAEILSADKFNAELQPKIDAALHEAEAAVTQFNRDRHLFETGIEYLKTYKRLNREWNDLNDKIKQLETENDQLFKERLNMPELSIGEDEKIMYLGADGVKREFCFPNVSQGESIAVTSRIQRLLNPEGANFILIPGGQNMGSRIFDVVAECKKFGVQYIIEITERKQDFKIMFEEEYFGETPKPAAQKPVTKKPVTEKKSSKKAEK